MFKQVQGIAQLVYLIFLASNLGGARASIVPPPEYATASI